MTWTRFPVLISIPHGGTGVPVELKDRLVISPEDIFADMDPCTVEIYHPGDRAAAVITADIARAFVDLNRAVDDLPPANPDGVIKQTTCLNKAIYIGGMEPDPALREQLIRRYHLPYHRRIAGALEGGGIRLGLDCHSMASSPPPIAPDRDGGAPRPLFCLGNLHGKACDAGTTERLARCLARAFGLEDKDITLNRPFAGGHITRTYGGQPVPWIQVEMNRSLYLSAPWFDPATPRVDPRRSEQLNRMFMTALELFFEEYQDADQHESKRKNRIYRTR